MTTIYPDTNITTPPFTPATMENVLFTLDITTSNISSGNHMSSGSPSSNGSPMSSGMSSGSSLSSGSLMSSGSPMSSGGPISSGSPMPSVDPISSGSFMSSSSPMSSRGPMSSGSPNGTAFQIYVKGSYLFDCENRISSYRASNKNVVISRYDISCACYGICPPPMAPNPEAYAAYSAWLDASQQLAIMNSLRSNAPFLASTIVIVITGLTGENIDINVR